MNIHGEIVQGIVYRNIQVSAILINAATNGSFVVFLLLPFAEKLKRFAIFYRPYINKRKNALFIVIEHHQFLSTILIKVHQINFEYSTCAAFILNFIKPKSAMLCNGSVNHIRIQLGGIDSLLMIYGSVLIGFSKINHRSALFIWSEAVIPMTG